MKLWGVIDQAKTVKFANLAFHHHISDILSVENNPLFWPWWRERSFLFLPVYTARNTPNAMNLSVPFNVLDAYNPNASPPTSSQRQFHEILASQIAADCSSEMLGTPDRTHFHQTTFSMKMEAPANCTENRSWVWTLFLQKQSSYSRSWGRCILISVLLGPRAADTH